MSNKDNSSKNAALVVSILTVAFLIGFIVLAWTEPIQTPPGGNVPAPINVGSIEQTKAGTIGAYYFKALGWDAVYGTFDTGEGVNRPFHLIGTYHGWDPYGVYIAGYNFYNNSNIGQARKIYIGGGGTERMMIDLNTGNVGIGTIMPSQILHLNRQGNDTAIRFQMSALLKRVTFSYTGAVQTWVVPAGVTSINVDVRGAQGGAAFVRETGSGGKGGRVQATISVTPGETLYIYVGGQPIYSENSNWIGGFNGGGNGGWCSPISGGGGGGASDIRRGGTALTNRIVVAGGGGGGTYLLSHGGVGGGLVGGDAPGGGGGGTQTAGGAGGVGFGGGGAGFAGTLGNGGWGGGCPGNGVGGGGGGGGYYGGGGGGGGGEGFSGAGGGGGSSLVPPGGTTTSGYQSGNGLIIIEYLSPEEVNWTVGSDQSDAGDFKISRSTTLGTNDVLKINAAGKVTIPGGIDPPFISFSAESREKIKQYAKSVESDEKVMLFWNKELHRLELYDIEEGRFYIITGELIPE